MILFLQSANRIQLLPNTDHFLSEEPSFSESLLEVNIIGIPTTADASTSTDHYQQTTEKSLGVASTTTTIRGRKGLLFEGRKFTLKFQRKCGISTWRCSTGGLCKAIASVKIRDNESHIIKMGDHTCTPISSEESSNITKIKFVVLSSNIKFTRSIAAALNVPYNRALYMRRRRKLAKQQTTAADK